MVDKIQPSTSTLAKETPEQDEKKRAQTSPTIALQEPRQKTQFHTDLQAKEEDSVPSWLKELVNDVAGFPLGQSDEKSSQFPLKKQVRIEPLPGTKIGVYRIVKKLGEGGMGYVFKAEHEMLPLTRALKFLREDLAQDLDFVKRFRQEAEALSQIKHQNIVEIYDFAQADDGTFYFVMEYLEGENLSKLLGRTIYFRDHAILCSIFSQIANALRASHREGIIHRDLKPANVFLTDNQKNSFSSPQVKLLDFGVAKLYRAFYETNLLTKPKVLLGTPNYMSPEQFEGKTVDARTDIFSFGIMLYKATVGRAPFLGKSFRDLAKAICKSEPVPPCQANPGANIPPALETLILKTLAKNPEERFASTEELLKELQEIQKTLEGPSPSTPTTENKEAIKPPSNPTIENEEAIESEPETSEHLTIIPPKKRVPYQLFVTSAIGLGILIGLSIFFFKEFSSLPCSTIASCWEQKDLKALQQKLRTHLTGIIETNTPLAKEVIVSLGESKKLVAADILYETLESPNPDDRRKAAAALALCRIGIRTSVGKIKALLNQKSENLDMALLASMMCLGDTSVGTELQKALERFDSRESFWLETFLEAALILARREKQEQKNKVSDFLTKVEKKYPALQESKLGFTLLETRLALDDKDTKEVLQNELTAIIISADSIVSVRTQEDASKLFDALEAALILSEKAPHAKIAPLLEKGLQNKEASFLKPTLWLAARFPGHWKESYGDRIIELSQTHEDQKVRIRALIALLAFVYEEENG